LRQLRCDWEAKLAEAAQDRAVQMHPAAFFAELKRWLPRDLFLRLGWVSTWCTGARGHLPALHAGRWLAARSAGYDRLRATE